MDNLQDLSALDADLAPDNPGRFFRNQQASEEEYLSSYIHFQYPFFDYGLYGAYEKDTCEFLGIAGFYLSEKCYHREDGRGAEWVGVYFGREPSGSKKCECLEIGYAVKKGARRKGYAKEWIRALTDYAQKTLLYDSIIARIPQENKASIAVALSAGGNLLVL